MYVTCHGQCGADYRQRNVGVLRLSSLYPSEYYSSYTENLNWRHIDLECLNVKPPAVRILSPIVSSTQLVPVINHYSK